jgi:hypothetical protein
MYSNENLNAPKNIKAHPFRSSEAKYDTLQYHLGGPYSNNNPRYNSAGLNPRTEKLLE